MLAWARVAAVRRPPPWPQSAPAVLLAPAPLVLAAFLRLAALLALAAPTELAEPWGAPGILAPLVLTAARTRSSQTVFATRRVKPARPIAVAAPVCQRQRVPALPHFCGNA